MKSPLVICFALAPILACESPRYVVTDTTPRTSLRIEALGCWALLADAGSSSTVDAELTPSIVQLDTTTAVGAWTRGARTMHRLDTTGRPIVHDAEGFAILDFWTSDSATDSIRLIINNGLYGSRWALALPADGDRVGTVHGRSQAFGDTDPPPDYPLRKSLATRVECAPSGSLVPAETPAAGRP